MSGFLSIRVTKEERRKLTALKVERDCKNMSEVVRLMCGFPRMAGGEPFEGSDDIDGVTGLARQVCALLDEVRTTNSYVYRLLKKEGIAPVKDRPLEHIIGEAEPIRENTARLPALPAGFLR
jgi:hypothetical protein